jgi:hypothetical protein
MKYSSRIATTVVGVVAILVAVFAVYWWPSTADATVCSPLQRIPTNDGVVWIVRDTCKEGLPHTTDANTICMPESAWADTHRRPITLTHERVHLAQKRALGEWYAFYARAWDYSVTPTCPPGIPASLARTLRPNPDTADAPYAIWRDRYVFFPVYARPDAPTLRDARIVVWDLQEGRALDAPPAAWRAAFCDGGRCPSQYEHPHEIAAVFLADGGGAAPAAAKLFAWRQ